MCRRRSYIPDEELELIEDEGDPGAGWDLDAATDDGKKSKKGKDKEKGKEGDTAKVVPADGSDAEGSTAGAAAGDAKETPKGD